MTEQAQRSGARGAGLTGWAGVLLLLYVLTLAIVLLSPNSDFQTAAVAHVGHALQPVLPDSWLSLTRTEVLLNALIIAPVSFLGSWVMPRVRWQDWTAYGFLGATTVELFQGLFLPGRQASFSDIVANTTGALLGAVLARWILRAEA